jgi:hypothetical protein
LKGGSKEKKIATTKSKSMFQKDVLKNKKFSRSTIDLTAKTIETEANLTESESEDDEDENTGANNKKFNALRE